MRKQLFGIALLAGFSLGATAQSQPSSRFEVASVKPSPRDGQTTFRLPVAGGQLTATGLPVRELVKFAYALLDFEVVGGPEWAAGERFDIAAKVEGDAPIEQVRGMMRTLLADRFKLVTRMQARERSVLALGFSDRNQTLGPKLQRAGAQCRQVLNVNGELLPLSRLAAITDSPNPDPKAPSRCGAMYVPGHISAREVNMKQFARGLSQIVGIPVVDKTTLSGYFDLDVEFSNEQALLAPDATRPPDVDSNRPTIYAALQEQLGLKLSSDRAPVTVFVIDRVERPTPD
jgi:uncharacterized protein (TIGR03435 family)